MFNQIYTAAFGTFTLLSVYALFILAKILLYSCVVKTICLAIISSPYFLSSKINVLCLNRSQTGTNQTVAPIVFINYNLLCVC